MSDQRRSFFHFAIGCMFITQFFSALGDTSFRNLIGLIVSPPPPIAKTSSQAVQHLALAQIAFMLPYVLFGPFVGSFADRYPKKWVLFTASGVRAGLLLFTLMLCLLVYQEILSVKALIFLIFLLGVMAALYSPAKYSILPELTPPSGLVAVNGIVESGTLLAILFGTVGMGAVADLVGLWEFQQKSAFLSLSGFAFCLAVVCALFFLSSVFATLLPGRPPYGGERAEKLELSPVEYYQTVKQIFRQPGLSKAVLGVALFWTLAAGVNVLFFPFGAQYLGLSSSTARTSLYFALAIGLIVGSFLVGLLPRSEDLRYVRPSAFGFFLTLTFLTFVRHAWLAYLILFLTGIFAGIYLIPLNAAMQRLADSKLTARVIATSNLLNNLAMIGISTLYFALSALPVRHVVLVLLCFSGFFMLILGTVPSWKLELSEDEEKNQ